jgi:hypothetical protein
LNAVDDLFVRRQMLFLKFHRLAKERSVSRGSR